MTRLGHDRFCDEVPNQTGLLLGVVEGADLSATVPTAPDTSNIVPGIYGARTDTGPNGEPIEIAAVKPAYLTDRNQRQRVPYNGPEAPGTIVVHLQERMLYLVQPGGDAIRYGVGIGKDGFRWSGRANIQYGKEWPVWTPPPEMIQRKPELVKWQGGQPGGLTNPLGARALYIYQNGKDTGYRIHGSPEWWSIGQAMSSGCVRLINQDIIDLYERVPNKSPILVTSGLGTV